MGMNFKKMTVGEIVVNVFRTAAIFQENGIDFCCNGNQTLKEACLNKGIEIADLTKRIDTVKKFPKAVSMDFNSWNIDFLCDYIVNIHHKYVVETLPVLVSYTNKIASVHGDNHPELIKIAELTSHLNKLMIEHLNEEEKNLFPLIKSIVRKDTETEKEIIKNEIRQLKDEHLNVGGIMDKIDSLTNHFKVPGDGCNTYLVTYKHLQQFENDLHIHVHLENNILFPKTTEFILNN